MLKVRNPLRIRLLLPAVALVLAMLTLSVATSPASAPKKVMWIDLAGQGKQAPDFVYFTANSGGSVSNIRWNNWGGKRAVGKGFFKDSSPSFPGKLNRNGPATLVAIRPATCIPDFGRFEGRKVNVYWRIQLRYSNGRGGTSFADVSDTAGRLTCR
jgi:hypothetical protein